MSDQEQTNDAADLEPVRKFRRKVDNEQQNAELKVKLNDLEEDLMQAYRVSRDRSVNIILERALGKLRGLTT